MLNVFRNHMICDLSDYTKHWGLTKWLPKQKFAESSQANPIKYSPVLSFLGDSEEIPRLSVFKWRESICAHSPQSKTPRTCLNGWIKLLWTRNCWLCLFFLLHGPLSSTIETEQEVCNAAVTPHAHHVPVRTPRSTCNLPNIMNQCLATKSESCWDTNDRWQQRRDLPHSLLAGWGEDFVY